MDSTRYVVVKPNTGQEHGGKYNSSVYRIELTLSGTASISLPTTNQFFAYYRGIQWKFSRTSGSSNSTVFDCVSGMQASSRLIFEQCIFAGGSWGSFTGSVRVVLTNNTNCEVRMSNCVGYNFTPNGGGVTCIVGAAQAATMYIYNCTFVDNAGALRPTSSNMRVKNCLFKGNTSDVSATLNAASNYNSSDSGSPPTNWGANSRSSQTFTFVDAGNGDYHLASGDAGAKDFGTDLSGDGSYPIAVDVDGTTRSGTWDIGFDEYVAPSAGPTIYLLGTANGDGWGDVQLGGSAPSSSTMSTGWTVGSTAADNYSEMAFGTERPANTFSGTAAPGASPNNTLKNGWRLGPTPGVFSAGDWPVSLPAIAVDQGGTQDGAFRLRMFSSDNADGSSATELTSGAVQLSTLTNIATGAEQAGTATLTGIPSIPAGKYIFFCCAWRVTGAA
jgi:hypothetical protein